MRLPFASSLRLLLLVGGLVGVLAPRSPAAAQSSASAATSVRTVCSGVPDGYAILRRTRSASCPNPQAAFNALVIGIPGPLENVCKSSPIPRGYVHVADLRWASCPSDLGMMIKDPGLYERVCVGSPLPSGYVRVLEEQVTSGPCPSRLYAEIKLPAEHEWICADSPVPPGYRLYRTHRANGCGLKASHWIVRADGRTPIGSLEHVTPVNHWVRGWACQPDRPGQVTEIHFYAGGPFPSGKAFAGVRTQPVQGPFHPLDSICGGRMPRAFHHQFTAGELAILGPGTHAVYAHAIDADGGPHPVLGPSRILRVAPAPSASPPIGNLLGITPDGLVYGWACQPDRPDQVTEVHLYAGAPFPGGRAFAAVRTGTFARWEEVERSCYLPGFRLRLTAAQLAALGPGAHVVYAHAIDADGGPHPLLPGARRLAVPLPR